MQYMDNIKNNTTGIKNKFDDDAMKNINALGDVLRRIHNRLVTEGYLDSRGKIWNIFSVVSVEA